MLNKFHKTFSWTIVFLVGLITATIELPIKLGHFLGALLLYLILAITAPLWVGFNRDYLESFIRKGFSFKFRIAIKAMRAYYKALDL